MGKGPVRKKRNKNVQKDQLSSSSYSSNAYLTLDHGDVFRCRSVWVTSARPLTIAMFAKVQEGRISAGKKEKKSRQHKAEGRKKIRTLWQPKFRCPEGGRAANFSLSEVFPFCFHNFCAFRTCTRTHTDRHVSFLGQEKCEIFFVPISAISFFPFCCWFWLLTPVSHIRTGMGSLLCELFLENWVILGIWVIR